MERLFPRPVEWRRSSRGGIGYSSGLVTGSRWIIIPKLLVVLLLGCKPIWWHTNRGVVASFNMVLGKRCSRSLKSKYGFVFGDCCLALLRGAFSIQPSSPSSRLAKISVSSVSVGGSIHEALTGSMASWIQCARTDCFGALGYS